ncbi:Vesicle coat complex COPI, beta' subunit [Trachipleistophora hominis]|uniref:Vesicle coat complex COPI, beta' subunit n=1 Tax=Trachipleistophora hominis TaxID=72359 RepID=L7JRU7_TRAHO|nr:Vesicle coat complex COPI, beta' subunit [Trachipleistophora hominis]
MKISQIKVIPSDRVKCIHKYSNYIVCGLFTGTLLFTADNTVKKQIKICNSAIRALASTTNLLVGTDDGEIVVLDPSLRRIKSIKAHNDFIRKIRTSKEYIFTCSDDFTIKRSKTMI